MMSKKQQQVSEIIKRNFSVILQQKGHAIYGFTFVTVTNTYISKDLGLAKIYLSVFDEKNKQLILSKLEENLFSLKKLLAYRIRNHVRRIPDIKIYLDETLDEMQKVNDLFKKVNKS